MGIVIAVDTDTGAELWQQVVYTVEYDHSYETDCQDVYITRLAIQGDELVVRDENYRDFRLNLETREIREVATAVGRFRQASVVINAEDPFGRPPVPGNAQAKRVAILDQHPEIEVPLSQRWPYYEEAGRSQEVCWILQPLLELAGNDPFYDVWAKALKRHQGQATVRPSPYELAARRELGELGPAQLEGLRALLKRVFQGLATSKPEPATLEVFSSFLDRLKPLQAPLLVEARNMGLHTRDVLDWTGYNLRSRGGMRRLVAGLRRWTVKLAGLFP